jgi:hypothetical protein
MGLLSWTVGLPLAPVRGVIALGEIIQRQVETETTDPAAVRRRLEALDEQRARGEIDEREAARQQEAILGAMVRPVGRPGRSDEPEEGDRR